MNNFSIHAASYLGPEGFGNDQTGLRTGPPAIGLPQDSPDDVALPIVQADAIRARQLDRLDAGGLVALGHPGERRLGRRHDAPRFTLRAAISSRADPATGSAELAS